MFGIIALIYLYHQEQQRKNHQKEVKQQV